MPANSIMTLQQIPLCCVPIKLNFWQHGLPIQYNRKNETKIEYYLLLRRDSRYLTKSSEVCHIRSDSRNAAEIKHGLPLQHDGRNVAEIEHSLLSRCDDENTVKKTHLQNVITNINAIKTKYWHI